MHPFERGKRGAQRLDLTQEMVEAVPAGRLAGDDAVAQRRRLGLEADEQVSVGAEGGEHVGQMGGRLDHLGHHQQFATGARMRLAPGAQVLAALREVGEGVRPGDLVGVDRRVRNPVVDQGVAERGEGDGLARSRRPGQDDYENGNTRSTSAPAGRPRSWARTSRR